MAFGFSPKYVENLALDNLNPEEYLVLAIEAAKKLEWDISYTSENVFIAFTKYSMSSWCEEIKVKIVDNNVILKSECIGNQILDWGKNKRNIKNLIETIDIFKTSLSPEELAQKVQELKSSLISEENDSLRQPPSTTKEKLTSFFSIFKPTENYFITPILINLNILIFIMMIFSGVNFLLPDNQSLLKWGANYQLTTLEGEWWRLITYIFLHIGFVHLLMNVYALLYIGLILEPYLGKTRFIAAYILTGVAASISSLWWNDLSISAGASGAIFGIYGVFLALLTTNLIEKSARKALQTSIVVFIGYNILNGLKPNSGIDNAAHIGGLLSGIVIGYSLIPSLKKPYENKLKFSTIGLLSVLIFSSIFLVNKKNSNDLKAYDKMITDFISLEAMALEFYKLPENTPKDEILYNINDRGIYYWKENINLIENLKDLDLPDDLRTKCRILKEYCELRIKSYELLYKTISEDTDQYNTQLEYYNNKIEAKIKNLEGE